MKNRRTVMAMALAAWSTSLLTTSASAQEAYPTKPVTIIVGFPAGSGTDVVARVMADRLSQRLGQQFIVDNSPGASGSMAAGLAARAKPDGYTLFVSGSASQVINPHLYKKLPYDVKKDFAPIGQISWLPYLLVVKQGSPYQSLKQLMEGAKKSPDDITYASTGVGSGANLVMSVLLSQAGVQMAHIPYKGSGQIQTDILGDQIVCTFDTIVSLLSMVKSGKLHALAISTAVRSEVVPEVPTVAEQGYPDFNLGVWLGLLGPSGLPSNIQAKLAHEIGAILQEPETRKKLLQLGSEPRATANPEEFSKIIRNDYDYWRKIINKFKIQVE